MNVRIWLMIATAISIASCTSVVVIANPSESTPTVLPISIARGTQGPPDAIYRQISFDLDLSQVNPEELITSNLRFVLNSCAGDAGRYTGEVFVYGETWKDLWSRTRLMNSGSIRAEIYAPRDLKVAKISDGGLIVVRPLSGRPCLSLEGYTRSGAKISSNRLEILRAPADD